MDKDKHFTVVKTRKVKDTFVTKQLAEQTLQGVFSGCIVCEQIWVGKYSNGTIALGNSKLTPKSFPK